MYTDLLMPFTCDKENLQSALTHAQWQREHLFHSCGWHGYSDSAEILPVLKASWARFSGRHVHPKAVGTQNLHTNEHLTATGGPTMGHFFLVLGLFYLAWCLWCSPVFPQREEPPSLELSNISCTCYFVTHPWIFSMSSLLWTVVQVDRLVLILYVYQKLAGPHKLFGFQVLEEPCHCFS